MHDKHDRCPRRTRGIGGCVRDYSAPTHRMQDSIVVCTEMGCEVGNMRAN